MPKLFKRIITAALMPILGWAILRTHSSWFKTEILSADTRSLHKLGRHFIVGYHDFEEVKRLVSRGAIGGVFVTRRNLLGKSAAELKREIDELQEIQAGLGLPRLLIATDQEGGIVSKLSPPLRSLPSLGEWAEDRNMTRIDDFARMQAEDLLTLGVNVNFSPVVDLKTPGPAGFLDLYSRIDRRAISADPEVVTQVALAYSLALKRYGVMPTLKHFPGLASIDADTHFQTGRTARSYRELNEKDFKPFREILRNTETFLMLGHVVVPDLDPDYPASLSRKVVQKLLRRDWDFQGVLVSDDFSMGPISGSPGGVGPAAVRALNAGVDLLLIAQFPDLYYPAMHALLLAERRGELASGFLEQSEQRLARARSEIFLGDKHAERNPRFHSGLHPTFRPGETPP